MIRDYKKGGDRASRVAGYKFDLHLNLAIEILVPGLEARAGVCVHGESKELVVDDLATPIAPCNYAVSVEAATMGYGQGGEKS